MMSEAAENIDVAFRSAGAPGSSAFTNSSCEEFSQSLDKRESFDEFLDEVDVFTFESEHEGVPESIEATKRDIPVRPSAEFVGIAGDRLLEKTALNNLAIPVAPFEEIPPGLDEEELATWLQDTYSRKESTGMVVKTRRGGYDGKGQWVFQRFHKEFVKEMSSLVSEPGLIVEDMVDFHFECSILAARSVSGETRTWPLTKNIHRENILRLSLSPFDGLTESLSSQASEIASAICEAHGYIGTIAVECFVTDRGLIVNEIAPRVHNSGHWTIEGCPTSQFEQHLRAITEMELGDTSTSTYNAMINIVGQELSGDARRLIDKTDGCFLHWYNKEVRPARKVGHITIVSESATDLNAKIRLFADYIDDFDFVID
jgi:5-(carboxyamino)imidazole ribonucleotide synthase